MVIEYISFALGVTHYPFRPAAVGIENPAGAAALTSNIGGEVS